MKIILTTFLTLAMASFAIAQNTDKALARVSYSFIHVQDTTKRDKPYTENMLLVIGKNASVYTSYDYIKQTNEGIKNLQEQMKNQAGSGNMSINVNKVGLAPTSKIDYFYFAKENKFYTKERLFNHYLIEENAPKIAWTITKDTTSFSGIHCQKATTYFKGRNWIAWFAPELPFQSGPWKLNGLPGLIIEAYDEKKDVHFHFAGIENVPADAEIIEAKDQQMNTLSGTRVTKIIGIDSASPYLGAEIKLPADAIKATKKELDKLKEARDKDPQGFMNAQMVANGIQGSFKINTVSAPKGADIDPAKPKLNNPIELPEKK